MRRLLGFIGLLSLSVPLSPGLPATSGFSVQIKALLENRINEASDPAKAYCRDELLCSSDILPRFYRARGFEPAWIRSGALIDQAHELVKLLRLADREGLNPENYHLPLLSELLLDEFLNEILTGSDREESGALNTLLDIEMLLTDAYLLFGYHLLSGSVNPETIKAEWYIHSRVEDLVSVLGGALDSGSVTGGLEKLKPRYSGYERLKPAYLDQSRILAGGGWAHVPAGPKLELGDQGPRVEALRQRLHASGDLPGQQSEKPDLFDLDLEGAVKRFQARHGLEIDGIVGKDTYASLNVPALERVRQIKANLERWRWLPEELGPRYLEVNVADYSLSVVENGASVLDMPVIVGKAFRRTPVFADSITYIEINPHWTVPHIIATEDMLPKVQGDPEYFVKQGIHVFESWSDGAAEIDPAAVDWSKLSRRNFPYMLKQDPGPLNALGRIKFMFPNKFGVYLHDTPSTSLFHLVKRSLSSGCIRVAKPIELAAYLLRDDGDWPPEKIRQAIAGGETRRLNISRPLAIYLLYWTAWVDLEGTIHYREDIYGRDLALNRALGESLPSLSNRP